MWKAAGILGIGCIWLLILFSFSNMGLIDWGPLHYPSPQHEAIAYDMNVGGTVYTLCTTTSGVESHWINKAVIHSATITSDSIDISKLFNRTLAIYWATGNLSSGAAPSATGNGTLKLSYELSMDDSNWIAQTGNSQTIKPNITVSNGPSSDGKGLMQFTLAAIGKYIRFKFQNTKATGNIMVKDAKVYVQ